MTVQLSVAARNAELDALEVTIGASAILQIRSGAQPANCAAANSGTLLASLTLPADWLAAAASGSKAMSGTWSDNAADAAGTAAHFRIFDSALAACHLQGSVAVAAADLLVDNVVFAAGQGFNITSFTLTAGNP